MTQLSPAAPIPAQAPLRFATPLGKLLAVLAGSLCLAAASRLEVPMYPVPMTMQTFAVAMVGALYGWRLGALTVLAWLAQAMAGLPVLSGGAGGLAPFVGPTAGYLAAFPLAAALVGWCVERGAAARWPACLAALLAAEAMTLGLGTLWLAGLIGGGDALALGAAPFLLGGLVKAALAACLLRAGGRLLRR